VNTTFYAKKALTCVAGKQTQLFDETTRCQKARDGVPLKKKDHTALYNTQFMRFIISFIISSTVLYIKFISNQRRDVLKAFLHIEKKTAESIVLVI
jgi:hypothetical protein